MGVVPGALRGRALRGQGWQPDGRASAGIALGAAALVLLGFLGLFHRALPPVTYRRLGTLLLISPSAPVPLPRGIPRPRQRSLMPLAPRTLQIPPAAVPETMQTWLDAAMSAYREYRRTQSLVMPPPGRYDPLFRALQARPNPELLQDGGSYRSLYGGAVARSGGSCAEMRQIQASPSPTNKVIVGFMVPCPGFHRPTIADALAVWAKKAQRTEPVPP